jgi:hypothetical protein
MSHQMNRFRSLTKPITKPSFTLKKSEFPDLSSNIVSIKQEWNCEKVSVFRDDAHYYPNGNVFEGDFDEKGRPSYGKLTYPNGDIYRGPLYYEWPKPVVVTYKKKIEHDYDTNTDKQYDEEDEIDFCEQEVQEDEYIIEEYTEYPENGVLTYANGKTFEGIFRFGDKKW